MPFLPISNTCRIVCYVYEHCERMLAIQNMHGAKQKTEQKKKKWKKKKNNYKKRKKQTIQTNKQNR